MNQEHPDPRMQETVRKPVPTGETSQQIVQRKMASLARLNQSLKDEMKSGNKKLGEQAFQVHVLDTLAQVCSAVRDIVERVK